MREIAQVMLAIFYKLPLAFFFFTPLTMIQLLFFHIVHIPQHVKRVEFRRIQVVFVAELSKYFKCLSSPTYSMIFGQLFEENTVAVQLYSLCCEQGIDWSNKEMDSYKAELARPQSLH